jgi:hypothetical protein
MNKLWPLLGGFLVLLVVTRVIKDRGRPASTPVSTTEGQAQVNMGMTYVGLAPTSGTQVQVDNPLQGLARRVGDFVGGEVFNLKRTVDPSNPNSALSRRRNQANSVLRPEDRLPERVSESGLAGAY